MSLRSQKEYVARLEARLIEAEEQLTGIKATLQWPFKDQAGDRPTCVDPCYAMTHTEDKYPETAVGESALQLLLRFMVASQPLCSFMLNQACRGLCLSISSIRHRLLPTMLKAFGNAFTKGGTHAMSMHGR